MRAFGRIKGEIFLFNDCKNKWLKTDTEKVIKHGTVQNNEILTKI